MPTAVSKLVGGLVVFIDQSTRPPRPLPTASFAVTGFSGATIPPHVALNRLSGCPSGDPNLTLVQRPKGVTSLKATTANKSSTNDNNSNAPSVQRRDSKKFGTSNNPLKSDSTGSIRPFRRAESRVILAPLNTANYDINDSEDNVSSSRSHKTECSDSSTVGANENTINRVAYDQGNDRDGGGGGGTINECEQWILDLTSTSGSSEAAAIITAQIGFVFPHAIASVCWKHVHRLRALKRARKAQQMATLQAAQQSRSARDAWLVGAIADAANTSDACDYQLRRRAAAPRALKRALWCRALWCALWDGDLPRVKQCFAGLARFKLLDHPNASQGESGADFPPVMARLFHIDTMVMQNPLRNDANSTTIMSSENDLNGNLLAWRIVRLEPAGEGFERRPESPLSSGGSKGGGYHRSLGGSSRRRRVFASATAIDALACMTLLSAGVDGLNEHNNDDSSHQAIATSTAGPSLRPPSEAQDAEVRAWLESEARRSRQYATSGSSGSGSRSGNGSSSSGDLKHDEALGRRSVLETSAQDHWQRAAYADAAACKVASTAAAATSAAIEAAAEREAQAAGQVIEGGDNLGVIAAAHHDDSTVGSVTQTCANVLSSELAPRKKPATAKPTSFGSNDAAALLTAHASGPWVAAFGAAIELEARKPSIALADANATNSTTTTDGNNSDCAPLSDPEMWAALETAVAEANAAADASARAAKWADHRAFRLRAGLADPGPHPPPPEKEEKEKEEVGAKKAPGNTTSASNDKAGNPSSSSTRTRGLWWKIRAENLRTAAGESEIHPSKRPTSGYVRKGPCV